MQKIINNCFRGMVSAKKKTEILKIYFLTIIIAIGVSTNANHINVSSTLR